MLTVDVPMGSLTFKGTASAIYLILHCQACDFLCRSVPTSHVFHKQIACEDT